MTTTKEAFQGILKFLDDNFKQVSCILKEEYVSSISSIKEKLKSFLLFHGEQLFEATWAKFFCGEKGYLVQLLQAIVSYSALTMVLGHITKAKDKPPTTDELKKYQTDVKSDIEKLINIIDKVIQIVPDAYDVSEMQEEVKKIEKELEFDTNRRERIMSLTEKAMDDTYERVRRKHLHYILGAFFGAALTFGGVWMAMKGIQVAYAGGIGGCGAVLFVYLSWCSLYYSAKINEIHKLRAQWRELEYNDNTTQGDKKKD